MAEGPRLLCIMGSGETAPTMVKVHRRLLDRLGAGGDVAGVLLDTPFGFQANADDIAAKAVEYFQRSVGATIEVASWRSAEDLDETARATFVARLRGAGYVFAGPGSPSYALRQWLGTPVPALLADKLATGGCVTFASAAALTLGVATVPVYEIYKVGAEPVWLDGLDLMQAAGLRAAVIPHYDNAEGGNHDTRYCYLGEPRLARLEVELADDVFVLGVDEHTGLVLDLAEGSAEVVGRGVVTVRRQGRSTTFPSGSTMAIDDLRRAAEGSDGSGEGVAVAPIVGAVAAVSAVSSASLLDTARELEARFDVAVAARDVAGAVVAVLELDAALVAWAADTLQSSEMDTGRSVLRSMVVRLGEVAEVGARDPADLVGPFVDALVDQRAIVRAGKDFAAADAIRDHLLAAGVEIKDTPEGTTWRLLV